MKQRAFMSRIDVEGALMVLSPFSFLFPFVSPEITKYYISSLTFASVATITCFGCSLTLFRKPKLGKILGAISLIGTFAAAFPYLAKNPFAALVGSVIFISAALPLIDFRITKSSIKTDHIGRCLKRAWGGALASPFIIFLSTFLAISATLPAIAVIIISCCISQILIVHWAIERKVKRFMILPAVGLIIVFLAFYFSFYKLIPIVVLLISLLSLLILPRKISEVKENAWEIILNHPARILIATFLGLSVIGTFLLALPGASKVGAITLVDAAFTAVSSVCVTGLIVLDTPNAFTLFGQFSILLLIQLGGLGIMSITTVALQAMGRRLSLKHERLLTSMTNTEDKDLIRSLVIILKFTFIAEGIGAVLLTFLFLLSGDMPVTALWRGIFTSISAFCNAGFSLQSDSLIPYNSNPFVLNVVALLIIFGGIAPATSLVVPNWLRGKQIPIPARIALMTTVILLLSGTIFIIAFEWNGVLAGYSIVDKIQNAWFQSVTLRTAGFNSVDIAGVTNPTFLVMAFFMFIGGSPGGTAGGIKTTTFGILAMTFWANITNRGEVITHNRRIPATTIYRAITIIASGMIFWFLVVLMLEATQQITARNIVFEATSAIGTVGLSTGATALLDEIGKIIIIIAMFGGRIGPMTLFMLLSNEQPKSASRCPRAKISLT